MTNKEKIQANWENPANYKPCRRKQYEAYVCMPPRGTVVIDKFVQHDAYRMMNGQAFFTVEQRSKNTGIAQRLNQLMQSGRVMVVSDNEPFVVVGASGEFYTCSAQVLQKKFRFLQNGQPVMINDVVLRQRMKNGVLDWSVIRFIPDSTEILSACYVPTAMKGQIQTFTGLMSINDPSMQHGKGDFIVAPVGQNRMPNFTMRIVVNGTVFADTYDIRGWEGCLGAGTTARINTNTLPRLI